VVDYASLGKPDAPSGTARELAERLDAVGSPVVAVPVEDTLGARRSPRRGRRDHPGAFAATAEL
jgi:4-hydroxy-tetrahydrodipicolinate reductase